MLKGLFEQTSFTKNILYESIANVFFFSEANSPSRPILFARPMSNVSFLDSDSDADTLMLEKVCLMKRSCLFSCPLRVLKIVPMVDDNV